MRGTGSNLPAVPVITATRGRGGGHHWLTGLLPSWAWLLLAFGLIATSGVGALVGFFQTITSLGGSLIGLGALALVVGGVVWAVIGFFGRMVPHQDTHARGDHMVRHGLIGAAFGGFLLLGGLNLAWGVGSVVVHDVMTAARSRVNLPAAPPGLQVQFPNLAGATAPAPTTPHP
jgi:type III secretory pathway component EscS